MKIAAATLSDDALFEEVVAIVHDQTGVKRAKITRDARLGEDLGIYGDDGHDLFDALHERFEMDWTGLDLGLHVGIEGSSWPWRMKERSDWLEPQPLCIGELMAALRAGQWPEYPRIALPRGVEIRRLVVGWGAFVFVAGMFVFGLWATLSRAGS